METLKFKTNINCGGCIANVTPTLNNLKGVKHWEVDTANPNKILSIEAEDGLTTVDVINTLKNKGIMRKQFNLKTTKPELFRLCCLLIW